MSRQTGSDEGLRREEIDAVEALGEQGVERFANVRGLDPSSSEPIELRPSLRYAHSRVYVESLARSSGLDIIELAEQPVREDQCTPIAGLFAWLAKP